MCTAAKLLVVVFQNNSIHQICADQSISIGVSRCESFYLSLVIYVHCM